MSSTSQLTDKTCSKCESAKPRAMFSKRAGYGDQLNAWCKTCHSAYMAEYSKTYVPTRSTPEENRERKLRNVYGLSVDEYAALLLAQGASCAICKSAEPGIGAKNFMIDHDHRTGEIRGLLCRACNAAIGLFRDSASLLVAAAEYLDGKR